MSAAGASGRRVIVIGGSSEIALAVVSELLRTAAREVVLVGRDPDRLAAATATLAAEGAAGVSTLILDARDTDRHEAVLGEAFERLGGADLVLLAVGMLGDRGGVPADAGDAVEVLRVNMLGAGSLLIHAARRLRDQRSGTLVVFSSVAGERVRASNVVYGAAKAGLDALALGLGDALRRDGVRVMVVRPGFVRTRMTRGLAAAPFATAPADVAITVARGLERGATVVWSPPALRWVMLVLRLLPRRIFRVLPV